MLPIHFNGWSGQSVPYVFYSIRQSVCILLYLPRPHPAKQTRHSSISIARFSPACLICTFLWCASLSGEELRAWNVPIYDRLFDASQPRLKRVEGRTHSRRGAIFDTNFDAHSSRQLITQVNVGETKNRKSNPLLHEEHHRTHHVTSLDKRYKLQQNEPILDERQGTKQIHREPIPSKQLYQSVDGLLCCL